MFILNKVTDAMSIANSISKSRCAHEGKRESKFGIKFAFAPFFGEFFYFLKMVIGNKKDRHDAAMLTLY